MLATLNPSNPSINNFGASSTSQKSSSNNGLDDDTLKKLLQEIETLLMMMLQRQQDQQQQQDPASDDDSGPAPVSRKQATPGGSQAAGPTAQGGPAAPAQGAPAQGAPAQAAPADAGAQQPPQQAAAPAPAAPAGPAAPVQSADGAGGDLSPQQVASKYKDEIASASKATGVPPGVLAGQIWQESKGKADTPGGGLMQLGDNEFKQYGGGDISNPADNINAGAKYMKDLADKFGGNTQAALRAYNSGPNGVDLGNLNSTPAGTGDPTYVQKVMQAGEQSGLSTTQA